MSTAGPLRMLEAAYTKEEINRQALRHERGGLNWTEQIF